MSDKYKSHSKIIYDPERGEIIDIETGEVVEENVPLYVDVRIFEPQDILKKRTHSLSVNVHDYGLHTEIKLPKFNLRFRKLYELNKKLRVANTWKERKMVYIFSLIHSVCGRLGIPQSIRNQVIELSRRLLAKSLFFRNTEHTLGITIDDKVLILIYIVMRNNSIPVTLNELFAKYYGEINKHKIRMAIRLIHLLIKRKLINNVKYISPVNYLDKYVSKLGLYEYRDIAYRMLVQIQQDGILQGRSPLSIIGAVLYLIGKVTKGLRYKDIASVLGITEVTIRHILKRIQDYYDIIIDMEVEKKHA